MGGLQRWQICCHALARGLGRSPCMWPMGGPALCTTTLYLLSHLDCFFSEQEAGTPQAILCIRKDVPVTALSECFIHWTTSLGKKKLSRGCVGTNCLQQFQMPGDLFSVHLQYLLGGVRRTFSRQLSVTDKAKFTAERGQDKICTER